MVLKGEKVDLFRKTGGRGESDIFSRPVLEQGPCPVLEAWNGPITPGPWFKPQSPNWPLARREKRKSRTSPWTRKE